MTRVKEKSRVRRLKRVTTFLIGLAAAISAVPTPASAANLNSGDVCTAKIFVNETHFCGTAPASGTLVFTNVGVHIVAVFTIAAGTNTVAWDHSVGGVDTFAS